MRGLPMLALAFVLLVACNEAGNWLSDTLALPVPGTVIGILILLAGLLATGRVPEPLRRVATFLLSHLNLFYVPAGVGLMGYIALLRRDLLPIAVALVVSTLLAMAVGALVFRWAAKGDDGEGME
ncbi:holin-like protein [Parvibaculum indicum]|uniref:CidA/LrgA family protein n=1 Tax=Parvibaculum indicum TaxID=562969 RepID=UPI00141EB6FC|nr:CidA/LrgA family protein [Parvibaculum indicum]NIJ40901.1 holin-like protein [Parvibaculum indicum]